MNTRESPYPPLGPDGTPVQQQYAPPPQPPQQQPQYSMQASQPYAQSYQPTGGQNYYNNQQQQQQQQYNMGGKQWEQQHSQDYGDKTQKFDEMKPK